MGGERATHPPDASQAQQQDIVLDGDGGGGLGGVDAAQVARLQVILAQQVAPLLVHAPHLAALIQLQHLGVAGWHWVVVVVGGGEDGRGRWLDQVTSCCSLKTMTVVPACGSCCQ